MLETSSSGDFLFQETGKRVAITRDCYSQIVKHFLWNWKPADQNLAKERPLLCHRVQSTHSALDCSGLSRPARSSARSSIKEALPAAGKPCAGAARRQGLGRSCSEAAAVGCCAG